MASSGSSQVQTSGSDEEMLQAMMDEKKRKRQQSNRDSARRSRARKQRQIEELKAHVDKLTTEKNTIAAALSDTTRNVVALQAENCVLRTQAVELSTRLQALTQILSCMNSPEVISDWSYISPLNWAQMNNQPIMASPDLYNSWH